MLSLNLHVRQDLGQWTCTAVLTRAAGAGIEPEVSTSLYSMPLTDLEWDGDDLTAVLSAVARWSGWAMSEAPNSH
jgi:hypothetical protein